MFSTTTRSGGLSAVLAIVLLATVALAIAAVGSPVAAQDSTEIANETVNVTDPANESVWVDVEFAENNSEVNATLYDPSGNETANATLVGAAGTTDSVEWSALDENATGNYTVVVTGNESDVAGLWIGVGDGDGTAIIAPSEDSSGSLSDSAIVGVVLVALVAVVLLRGRE